MSSSVKCVATQRTLKRWYAELVRKTNNRPRADTKKECAVAGMFMCTAKVCSRADELLWHNRCTIDTAKLHPVTDKTGFRISRSTLDCGKL